MSDYCAFVAAKRRQFTDCGFVPDGLPESLFPHQQALVSWACRKGRAAIFADTGLGKTAMQVSWAQQVASNSGGDVLILAPLAVAAQTAAEAARLDVDARVIRQQSDHVPGTISIVNYDRLHLIESSAYAGVVLDESSIIKHHDSKTLGLLMDAFSRTPYRLCATATPSPNDWTELGTHAEFLGVCSRVEMLSEFFVHDGGETQVWRLKGHARDAFWQWVASWGALVRSPADLGFDGTRYELPALSVDEHIVDCDSEPLPGQLFAMEAQTLSERRKARRASLDERVRACAELVNSDRQPWVVWCDLNDESEMLTSAIDGAVEVRGSQSSEDKERRLAAFASGEARVLVSKPSICGFGLNWQHAARMAFVGVTDSWESYYQAVRRCWRFGQQREVQVHIFSSSLEGAVLANLKRKESDAKRMAEQLSDHTRASVQREVLGAVVTANSYDANQRMEIPEWLIEEVA